MARDTWYRLDNVGKFYSSQAGSTAQTVFRFSATLIDEIDVDALQYAVEKAVDYFPGFNVCLRSGMFWHYLEQSSQPPLVQPENLPICFGLHVDVKSVLFRVSYYQNRINFEVSHIVSDGRGSLNFFKVLLSLYLQKLYGIEGIPLEYDGSDYQKAENSFDKYFEKDKASSDYNNKESDSKRKSKVFKLTGWRDEADPTYLEYHIPMTQVRNLARSYNVSVTALIVAVFMYSFRQEMPRRFRKREIRISVPVDLRQYFDSTTTKNFFGLVFLSYVPQNDESIEELALMMHQQLKVATTPESLKPRMNRMIALEKNPLLRLSPMFAKDFALEIADWFTRRKLTTTVSNLGKIALDTRLAPYIQDINIMSSTTGITMTFCSFEDDLSIGISSVYSNHDVVKHFCRFFSSQDILGYINISKTSEEVAADWREVQFETSVKRLSGQVPEAEEEATAAADKERKASKKRETKKRTSKKRAAKKRSSGKEESKGAQTKRQDLTDRGSKKDTSSKTNAKKQPLKDKQTHAQIERSNR